MVTEVLRRLGCGFDCASATEIKQALDCGTMPENIIFANPCKMPSMIEFARSAKVDKMTFDSPCELDKIKAYYPDAKLVVRITTDDKDSEIPLSGKFGCHLEELPDLFQKAKDLELDIIGVSFHVGSGSKDPTVFSKAIQDSKETFKIGKAFGYDMKLLDIGGGFPGSDNNGTVFKKFADAIKAGLKQNFNDIPDLEVIAEPGRYFVATSCSLLSSVICKKVQKDKVTGETKMVYYISDGAYSSLIRVLLDHQIANNSNTFALIEREGTTFKSTIYGPTCDSLDIICEDLELPELNLEDHLIHLEVGSYGGHCFIPGSLTFNGFSKPSNQFYIN